MINPETGSGNGYAKKIAIREYPGHEGLGHPGSAYARVRPRIRSFLLSPVGRAGTITNIAKTIQQLEKRVVGMKVFPELKAVLPTPVQSC
jgi:hypothetical protein